MFIRVLRGKNNQALLENRERFKKELASKVDLYRCEGVG